MSADIWALPLRFPRAITLVPGFTDIGKFPGSSVETGESKLGSDNHLVHVGLARGNVGGNAMRLSAAISPPRNHFKRKGLTRQPHPCQRPLGIRGLWQDRGGRVCGPRYRRNGTHCWLHHDRGLRVESPLYRYRARARKCVLAYYYSMIGHGIFRFLLLFYFHFPGRSSNFRCRDTNHKKPKNGKRARPDADKIREFG